MASTTKEALASALRELMKVKPIDKITIKDIVELCGVNRQTFYYHFDDVYDLLEWIFEDDAERILPHKVVYERWREDVMTFFNFLYENKAFTLNVYHSNSRPYMLRYLKGCLGSCIRSFADIVSEGMNITREDYEFVIEFYSIGVIGLIDQWCEAGMVLDKGVTMERFLKTLDNSVENLLARFAGGGRHDPVVF